MCVLFEEKAIELIADAEKYKQIKQSLELHNQKPLDHREMYLPGVNSTSHALSTAQQRTNDPKSVANSTMSTVNAVNNTYFKGNCNKCGRWGHRATYSFLDSDQPSSKSTFLSPLFTSACVTKTF